MKEHVLFVDISGYWRMASVDSIITLPGIFFVYESQYDQISGALTLLRLLYIGQGENIRESIRSHPDLSTWQSGITNGNEICFAAGLTDNYYRQTAVAAYNALLNPPYAPVSGAATPQNGIRIIHTGCYQLIPESLEIRADRSQNYLFKRHHLHRQESPFS